MLQQFISDTAQTLGHHVPNLIGSFSILLLGWLIALAVSMVVGSIISRTPLNRILNDLLGQQASLLVPADEKFKTITYYFVMLMVLIAFFETLGLTAITEPLQNLVVQIFNYAPRVLLGVGLLILAWITASAVKAIVTSVLNKTNIDERINQRIQSPDTETEKAQFTLSKTLSETAYWLIFLFFIPSVLEAFSLSGTLEPVVSMLNKVLGYLPNIFSASVLFAIGWFVANVVQRLTKNLLMSFSIDQLSEKLHLTKILQGSTISDVASKVVYFLIIVPLTISALDTLEIEAISVPAKNMLNIIVEYIPLVLGSAVLMGIGVLLANWISELATSVLETIGFNRLGQWLGIQDEYQPVVANGQTPSKLAGSLAKVTVLYFVAIEALNILQLHTVTLLLQDVLIMAGHILMGLVVLGIGLFIANFLAQLIQRSQVQQAHLLSLVARGGIILLASAMALRQMGLANDIVNMAFGALVGGLGIAAAIAFGFGGREVAADILKDARDSLSKPHAHV